MDQLEEKILLPWRRMPLLSRFLTVLCGFLVLWPVFEWILFVVHWLCMRLLFPGRSGPWFLIAIAFVLAVCVPYCISVENSVGSFQVGWFVLISFLAMDIGEVVLRSLGWLSGLDRIVPFFFGGSGIGLPGACVTLICVHAILAPRNRATLPVPLDRFHGTSVGLFLGEGAPFMAIALILPVIGVAPVLQVVVAVWFLVLQRLLPRLALSRASLERLESTKEISADNGFVVWMFSLYRLVIDSVGCFVPSPMGPGIAGMRPSSNRFVEKCSWSGYAQVSRSNVVGRQSWHDLFFVLVGDRLLGFDHPEDTTPQCVYDLQRFVAQCDPSTSCGLRLTPMVVRRDQVVRDKVLEIACLRFGSDELLSTVFELLERSRAAVVMQRIWKGYRARKEVMAQRLAGAWRIAMEEENAARRIQQRWRSYCARQQYLTLRRKVIIVQSIIRMAQAKKYYQRYLRAVRYCQHLVRTKIYNARMSEELLSSTIRIQSYVRMWLARKHYRQYRAEEKAARLIQRVWRGHRARRMVYRILKMKRRRAYIAEEIAATESSYQDSLKTMMDVYVVPAKRVLDAIEVEQVFSNIEAIADLHLRLRDLTRERVSDWSTHEMLGDVFLRMYPEILSLYTMYINNFDSSSASVNALKQRSAFFEVYSAPTQPHFVSPTGEAILMLESYLIMPVQRIPRYVLLLADLLKNTRSDSPDHGNLKQALQKMRSLASHINISKQKGKTVSKVAIVQENIGGKFDSLVTPTRRFIREGQLYKKPSSGARGLNHLRAFFLFNDVLVYAAKSKSKIPGQGKKYQFKGQIPLLTACVRDVEDTLSMKNAFELVSTKGSYQIYCENPYQKKVWMTDIRSAIADLHDAMLREVIESPEPVQVLPLMTPAEKRKSIKNLQEISSSGFKRRSLRGIASGVWGSPLRTQSMSAVDSISSGVAAEGSARRTTSLQRKMSAQNKRLPPLPPQPASGRSSLAISQSKLKQPLIPLKNGAEMETLRQRTQEDEMRRLMGLPEPDGAAPEQSEKPQDEQTAAAPQDEQTAAAPQDEQTAAAPQDEQTAAAPQDEQTAAAPQEEQVAAAPQYLKETETEAVNPEEEEGIAVQESAPAVEEKVLLPTMAAADETDESGLLEEQEQTLRRLVEAMDALLPVEEESKSEDVEQAQTMEDFVKPDVSDAAVVEEGKEETSVEEGSVEEPEVEGTPEEERKDPADDLFQWLVQRVTEVEEVEVVDEEEPPAAEEESDSDDDEDDEDEYEDYEEEEREKELRMPSRPPPQGPPRLPALPPRSLSLAALKKPPPRPTATSSTSAPSKPKQKKVGSFFDNFVVAKAKTKLPATPFEDEKALRKQELKEQKKRRREAKKKEKEAQRMREHGLLMRKEEELEEARKFKVAQESARQAQEAAEKEARESAKEGEFQFQKAERERKERLAASVPTLPPRSKKAVDVHRPAEKEATIPAMPSFPDMPVPVPSAVEPSEDSKVMKEAEVSMEAGPEPEPEESIVVDDGAHLESFAEETPAEGAVSAVALPERPADFASPEMPVRKAPMAGAVQVIPTELLLQRRKPLPPRPVDSGGADTLPPTRPVPRPEGKGELTEAQEKRLSIAKEKRLSMELGIPYEEKRTDPS